MAAHICNHSTETEAGRLIASLGYTARACLKFKRERKKKKVAWCDYLPASLWETEQGPGGPTSPELWVGAWLIVDLCARGASCWLSPVLGPAEPLPSYVLRSVCLALLWPLPHLGVTAAL